MIITEEIIDLAQRYGACRDGLEWARECPRETDELPRDYGRWLAVSAPLPMDERYHEWTSCEYYGHNFVLDDDSGRRRCSDCGKDAGDGPEDAPEVAEGTKQ